MGLEIRRVPVCTARANGTCSRVMTSIPAATLVLMRPGSGATELLMIERGAAMAFAPGALVFPGGRIDPDDRIGRDEIDAAKVAAIRETIEETGIVVGVDPVPGDSLEAGLRAELAGGTAFSALLARHELTLRLDALVPFARWCPTFKETRSFDTLFFLAHAPADTRVPTGDAVESVHASWVSAADVLARADRGEAHIIFPTRRNLERLARFASFEDARNNACGFRIDTIVPWIETRDGADWLCIPEDRGYPVTAELLAEVRRA